MRKIELEDSGVRQYRIWRFKLKSEVEKVGRVLAPTYEGLHKGYNPETGEITFLMDWRRTMEKARKERKPWVPEGEERTFKEDELDVLNTYVITYVHIGEKKAMVAVN